MTTPIMTPDHLSTRVLWRALSILLLLVVSSWGCKDENTTSTSSPEEEITSDLPSATDGFTAADGAFNWCTIEPKTLDPAKGNDMASFWVSYNLFEGLMAPAPDNAPPRLGVAATLPVVENEGLSWTFTLRKDARWSDGVPVTAQHFVDGWRRAVDPATAGTQGDAFRILQNANEILEGQAHPSTLGATATDDHTLQIQLKHPSPVFLSSLRDPPFSPVRLDLIAKHGDSWARAGKLVGNGAFVLVKWNIRDQMNFIRNEQYWDRDSVKLERATLRHAENNDFCKRLFDADKVHVLNPVPANQIGLLQAEGNPELSVYPKLASAGIVFNGKRPPLDNLKIRKAIALSIDREALVKHVLGRGDRVVTHLFPGPLKDLTGYVSPVGSEFDPEAGRKLLAEAGYPRGAGLPPISYLYNTHDLTRRIAEYVQRSLKENLEIEITLENVEWGTFLDRMGNRDFDMAPWNFSGLADPLEWAEMFRSTGTHNWAGFENAAYDELIKKAQAEHEIAQRNKLVAKAETQLLEAQVVAPLFSKVGTFRRKALLKGYFPQTQDIHLLKYIYLR